MGDSVQKRQNILGEQRVSDAVRTAYADRLSQYFSEGYINLGEFEARSDAVVQAKTMSELKVVFKDLPGDMEVAKARPVRPDGSFLVKSKPKTKRSPVAYINFFIVLSLWVTMMVLFATGHGHSAINVAMTMIIFVLFSTAISPPKKRRK